MFGIPIGAIIIFGICGIPWLGGIIGGKPVGGKLFGGKLVGGMIWGEYRDVGILVYAVNIL